MIKNRMFDLNYIGFTKNVFILNLRLSVFSAFVVNFKFNIGLWFRAYNLVGYRETRITYWWVRIGNTYQPSINYCFYLSVKRYIIDGFGIRSLIRIAHFNTCIRNRTHNGTRGVHY